MRLSARLSVITLAVEHFIIEKATGEKAPEPPPVIKPTYKQKWAAYDLAQTHEKGRFLELLYELCQNIEGLPRKAAAGRNRLSMQDMIFSVCYKIFSSMSARRFMSDLRDAKEKGYISTVPHYTSIFNYLRLKEMQGCLEQLIKESSFPLVGVESNFAADSSGFTTGQFKRWMTAKYSSDPHLIDKQDWLKVHLMCGVTTNVVTSVTITDGYAGDSPQFSKLVEETSENFAMQSVVADKAYSSAKNLKLVIAKGAMPYIPFKEGSKPTERSGSVWQRMLHFYLYNQETFKRNYHRRSNVETTFSMIKMKFGERLRSKTRTAQTNELLCKILCHNLCCVIQSIYELKIEANFSTESSGE